MSCNHWPTQKRCEVCGMGRERRPPLDFDDAGAHDHHPARGVAIGDIRAWHDEIERLRAALRNVRCYIQHCDHEPALDEIDAALSEKPINGFIDPFQHQRS